MATPRSSRVTRSSAGLNGLDENFCGRTLRNRSIAQPEETPASPPPRARSPKKRQDHQQDTEQDTEQDTRQDSPQTPGVGEEGQASPGGGERWVGSRKRTVSCSEKDGALERTDCCGGGGDSPPQLKRSRRCPRPKDTPPDRHPGLEGASPGLFLEAGGKEEVGGEHLDAHRCSNGLAPPPGPSLLNGGQGASPSTIPPIVPCRHSEGSGEAPSLPEALLEAQEEVVEAHEEVVEALEEVVEAREEVMEAREEVVEAQEEVVETREEVVECLAQEEQMERTNGCLTTPGQEVNNSSSGEATPPSPSPTQPTEHRHTLGAELGGAAEEEEEEEEPDVYYFESDHLALKHNKDYQRLLQTIGVLEAQRTQAILDLEALARQQRLALDDPISFVEALQEQVDLSMPRPQRVVQLPEVAWDQYTSGLGHFQRDFCDEKRKTRRLNLIFDKGLPDRPNSPVEVKKEGESSMYSSLPTSDALENGRQTQVIRGRVCHTSKPDTFNQLWSVEEQKKLEQLLLKFPPEEVESRRWQKIAEELGNRTAKQVASRVQKYFIKLTKAGIPVPGRTPNMCMYTKKVSNKRQHHLNKHLYRPSTFLTSYEPPVYMDEEEQTHSYYGNALDDSEEEEEGLPLEVRNLPEYQELLELKRLKKRKMKEIQQDLVHPGYKCDVCGMEPIQGVRWHCQDCPQDNAVDVCSNCSDCLVQTDSHLPEHRLAPLLFAQTLLDRDYCLPQSCSYLDPNYFPANR